MAIAIGEKTHELGLRPISLTLVNLRALVRVEMPSSASDLAVQVVSARQDGAMAIGCVGLLGALTLPILLPIEIVRGHRVRRHNRAMLDLLASLPRSPGAAGYRDDAAGEVSLRKDLLSADTLLAIDWNVWRDGKVCLAGTALGVVRGNEHLVPWITVYRGWRPRDAIDASALALSLGDMPVVWTRWEWQLDDPFEAVERK